MVMPARFEGTRMGASGWIYPTLRTHLSRSAGTKASGSCSFTTGALPSTGRHPHFLSPLLPSSTFPCFTLFYISVTLVCLLCQLPFHARRQKCVQVNISCLLMLKGSGGSRYVTGRELSVPRAAIVELIPSPLNCFYPVNNGYV